MDVDDKDADVAVEVADLVKRYPKAPVDSVGGISFGVRRGEVFGFLGPNGAGKTTTIGILTTRIRPTAGRARVAGVDVTADPVGARRVLGVVPQQNNLDRSLSVRQNLLFHASYHGVPRAVQEDPGRRAARPVRVGRPGQREAGRLLRGPDPTDDDRPVPSCTSPTVLFLDEPSTGLDPAARLFTVGAGRPAQGGGDHGGDHHPRHGGGSDA